MNQNKEIAFHIAAIAYIVLGIREFLTLQGITSNIETSVTIFTGLILLFLAVLIEFTLYRLKKGEKVWIQLVTVPFHVTVVIFSLIGFALLYVLTSNLRFSILFLAIFAFAIAVAIEILLNHLKNEKHWAWVICLFVMSILGLNGLYFLAIPAIIALFAPEVRNQEV